MGFAQTVPAVISGTTERIVSFESKFIDARIIDIWLPNGYSDQKKYAVLYMQDGQMLFDPTTTWNKQAWEIDDCGTQLMSKNLVQQFIVIGIWNGGKVRHASYFPEKPFTDLTSNQQQLVVKQLQDAGKTAEIFVPNSDNYLKFLTQELKPYINSKYSVYKDLQHTFIGGSSMGGLISIYALCEYPTVFGGAICMSTHWPGSFASENNPMPQAFINYLEKHLPQPDKHKIYFDYGNQTLDALYPALQQKVDQLMTHKGYKSNNWQTKFFDGDDHSEKSWKNRLHIPLSFILKK